MRLAEFNVLLIWLIAANIGQYVPRCGANRGYFLAIPSVLRSDTEGKISITIIEPTEPVNVDLQLYSSEGNLAAKATQQIFGKGTMHFKIPAASIGSHTLKICGNCVLPNKGQFTFINSTQVTILQRSSSVFILTDKPVYRPAEKVRIHILNIKPDLKPAQSDLLACITDPNGSRMVQWDNIKVLCNGISDVTFPLSSQPVMGTWTIHVEAQGHNYNASFDIQKYERAKFEIIVKPPRYITDWDRCYGVYVKAKYLHGKAVQGKLTTMVSIKGKDYYDKFRSISFVDKKQINGAAVIKACINRMMARSPSQKHFRGFLHIEAEVMTQDGSKVKVKDESCVIQRNLVDIEFSRETRTHFKPGLPYYGKIFAFHPNGEPAKNVTIAIHTSWYRTEYPAIEGHVQFVIPNMPSNVQSVWIDAKVARIKGLDVSGSYNAVYKSVNSWISSNGCHILIEDPQHQLQIGRDIRFSLLSTCTCNFTLYYEVMSKGTLAHSGMHFARPISKRNIHTNNDIQNNLLPDPDISPLSAGHTCKESFQFLVTDVMMPLSRMVVYYFLPDGQIVTDSILLPVQATFNNKLTLGLPKHEVSPGESSSIHVTSTPGSCVCLSAVDKGVHLLRPNEKLSTKKILDELERYDISSRDPDPLMLFLHKQSHKREKRDAIWWDAVKAKQPHYAFQETGLIVLTDMSSLANSESVAAFTGPVFQSPFPGELSGADYLELQSRRSHYTSHPSNMVSEAWIWDCFSLPNKESFLSVPVTVPDNVGKWMIDGLSLSPTTGLALGNVKELTSSKNFFLEFSLPRTVIQGEMVLFSLTVHNYLDYCISVQVKFKTPKGVRLAISRKRKKIVDLCIQPHDTATVHYMVLFKLPGLHTIRATAKAFRGPCCDVDTNDVIGRRGKLAEDAVEQTIQCEAEGIPSSYTNSVFFCPDERIHLSTPQRLQYQYVKKPDNMQGFDFSVKAGADVHIALSEEPRDNDKLIEIVLGGKSNTESWVAKGTGASPVITMNTHGILNNDEFRTFRIIWSEQEIKVGAGSEGGEGTIFLSYLPEERLEVNYIGFSSGEAESSEFRIWRKSEMDQHYGQVLHLGLPTKHIPGSSKAKASVVGNVMGSSIESVDHLVNLPNGCGEQNMAAFASAVSILSYMNNTRSLQSHLLGNTKEYLLKGYQRQLTYKRYDGSYSAFGDGDKSSNIWLTGFVLKSYLQAQKHMYIDDKEVQSVLAWIMKQQRHDGSFPVIGKANNRYIQGGLRGRISLTAYLTIALMENGHKLKINKYKLKETRHFLETRLHRVSDPYNLALCAYALNLLNSNFAQLAVRQLNKKAQQQDGMTFWKLQHPKSQEIVLDFTTSSKEKVMASEVETAAYAVLTYMTRRDISSALPVVKWLSQQRNSHGGFFSTQDTSIGLQALAEFAKHTHPAEVDLSVTLATTNMDMRERFSITKSNHQVTQVVDIPSLPTGLFISAVGQGCALLQVEVSYSIPEESRSPSFSLKMKTRKNKKHKKKNRTRNRPRHGGKRYRGARSVWDEEGVEDELFVKDEHTLYTVETCTRWMHEGSSNMAVLEVSLISGYQPIKDSLEKLLRHGHLKMRRYQVEQDKVLFFFEEVKSDCMTCISFEMIREHEVQQIKPVPVRIYDYYEPGYGSINFYEPPSADTTDYCYREDGDCSPPVDTNILPRCSCYQDCHDAGPVVCGTNHLIYPSRCHMAVEACKQHKQIHVTDMSYCQKEIGSGDEGSGGLEWKQFGESLDEIVEKDGGIFNNKDTEVQTVPFSSTNTKTTMSPTMPASEMSITTPTRLNSGVVKHRTDVESKTKKTPMEEKLNVDKPSFQPVQLTNDTDTSRNLTADDTVEDYHTKNGHVDAINRSNNESELQLTSYNPNSTQLTPYVDTESNATLGAIKEEYGMNNELKNSTEIYFKIENENNNITDLYKNNNDTKANVSITYDDDLLEITTSETDDLNDVITDAPNKTKNVHEETNEPFTSHGVHSTPQTLVTTSSIPIIPSEQSPYTPLNMSDSFMDNNSTEIVNTQLTITDLEASNKSQGIKIAEKAIEDKISTTENPMKQIIHDSDTKHVNGHPRPVWLSFFPLERSKRYKHHRDDMMENPELFTDLKIKNNQLKGLQAKTNSQKDALTAQLENLKFHTNTPPKVINTKVSQLIQANKMKDDYTSMHNIGKTPVDMVTEKTLQTTIETAKLTDNEEIENESGNKNYIRDGVPFDKLERHDDSLVKVKDRLDVEQVTKELQNGDGLKAITEFTRTEHEKTEYTPVTTDATIQEVSTNNYKEQSEFPRETSAKPTAGDVT